MLEHPRADIEAFLYDQGNFEELEKVANITVSSDLLIETGAGYGIFISCDVPQF